jgi:NAD(P)-dependent dehydrogenase (short-subunit alcohol dehydrogenase family)
LGHPFRNGLVISCYLLGLLSIDDENFDPAFASVNNAAHSTRDGFELLDATKLDAHYAVNKRATFLLAVEFARRAKALGRLSGHIISMSSGQDWGPMPGELAYVATKGVIEAFTLSLASDLAYLGITVNAVDPGATDRGWMTEQRRREWSVPSGVAKHNLPDDAARVIVFLASDAARHLTGQVIHVGVRFSRAIPFGLLFRGSHDVLNGERAKEPSSTEPPRSGQGTTTASPRNHNFNCG